MILASDFKVYIQADRTSMWVEWRNPLSSSIQQQTYRRGCRTCGIGSAESWIYKSSVSHLTFFFLRNCTQSIAFDLQGPKTTWINLHPRIKVSVPLWLAERLSRCCVCFTCVGRERKSGSSSCWLLPFCRTKWNLISTYTNLEKQQFYCLSFTASASWNIMQEVFF